MTPSTTPATTLRPALKILPSVSVVRSGSLSFFCERLDEVVLVIERADRLVLLQQSVEQVRPVVDQRLHLVLQHADENDDDERDDSEEAEGDDQHAHRPADTWTRIEQLDDRVETDGQERRYEDDLESRR